MNHIEVQTKLALVLKHKVPTWIGNRMRIDFWLFVNKARDIETLEIIEWFKSKGLFRSSAISGLRAMWAYRNHNVDMLLEEMPDLLKMLEGKISSGGGGQLDKIEGLLEIIAATQKHNNTYTLQQPTTATALPAAPKAEVKQAAAMDASDIADNFLSMFQ